MHMSLDRLNWIAASLLLVLTACSSPQIDLDTWRTAESVARPAPERGTLADDMAAVETWRDADRLTEARALALSLAAENPDEARFAFLASRAESDGVALFAQREKKVRNAVAASALDYAQHAEDLGESTVEARAQFAWALGSATHLQGMMSRTAHARRTLEVATAVIERDPDEPTALATLAVLNLRLETLPWIAKVMARGRPDSSLDEAVALARHAVEARPSRENRIILAKCLTAAGDEDAAMDVLDEALAAPADFPRDAAVEHGLRELRGTE